MADMTAEERLAEIVAILQASENAEIMLDAPPRPTGEALPQAAWQRIYDLARGWAS